MATKKAEYFKFNQDGNVWDLYYFKTSADLIAETDTKKILTGDERQKISDFLTTFDTANKLVQVGSGGKIPAGVIPDISDTYLKKTGPSFDGTLQGNTGKFNDINANNSTNYRLVIGSRTQEQDSTYITFKDNGNGKGEMELYAHAGIKLSTDNSVIDVSENWIRNVKEPLLWHEAANKEYVDNKVSSGFTTRAPVKSASLSNIDITAELNSLDGFTLTANDRVLLKNQEDENENGVYKLDSSKKPVKDANDSGLGSAVFVENGDTNNDYIYHCSTKNSWVAFSKPDTIKPGTGLSKSGTTLSIAENGVKDSMIDSLNPTKLEPFESNDIKSTWNNLPNASNNGSLGNHIISLYSAIKLLRVKRSPFFEERWGSESGSVARGFWLQKELYDFRNTKGRASSVIFVIVAGQHRIKVP